MYKIAIPLIGAALLVAAVASACPRGGPHGGRAPIEHLTESLQLDDYQAGEVERILDAQHATRRALFEELRAEGAGPTGAQRERMQALHEETVAQLGTVLTAEQLAQFEAMVEEHRRQRQERHRGHGSYEESPDDMS